MALGPVRTTFDGCEEWEEAAGVVDDDPQALRTARAAAATEAETRNDRLGTR